MKPRIVIIGANDFQNQAILKAKQMGYETHVFAWKDDAAGEKTADFFYPISITEKDIILEQCRKIQPAGIVSIASDLAVHTVNHIANAMGLVGNSEKCTIMSTNKYKMRQTLQKAGLRTPHFMLVHDCDECANISFSYPLIVKPIDRSGSRGVTKVNCQSELENAVKRCIDCSFEKMAIVEEFIVGDEFSAEFISYQGKHHFLALTKKFTTEAPNFIETGHMQPADINRDMQETIIVEIIRALNALNIENGASHSEFRIGRDSRVHIIEIGSRMGGDCIGSDLVKISTGYDFLKMTIDVACGKAPDITKTREAKAAFVRFVFDDEDILNLKRIQKSNPDVIYRVSDIKPIDSHAVTDSSLRYGYYILACNSTEQGYDLLNF